MYHAAAGQVSAGINVLYTGRLSADIPERFIHFAVRRFEQVFIRECRRAQVVGQRHVDIRAVPRTVVVGVQGFPIFLFRRRQVLLGFFVPRAAPFTRTGV